MEPEVLNKGDINRLEVLNVTLLRKLLGRDSVVYQEDGTKRQKSDSGGDSKGRKTNNVDILKVLKIRCFYCNNEHLEVQF